jgi:hypothetical protein
MTGKEDMTVHGNAWPGGNPNNPRLPAIHPLAAGKAYWPYWIVESGNGLVHAFLFLPYST